MSEQITYRNDQKQQFCQIRLSDDTRLLISVAEESVNVMKMKWRGLVPGETLYSIQIKSLSENPNYAKVVSYLRKTDGAGLEYSTESKKYGYNQLDVFRVLLLKCETLSDVNIALAKFSSKKV